METQNNYQPVRDTAHTFRKRTFPQKVCIGIGIAFIFLGAAGLLYPEIAGGHFSLTMNFLHLTSGIISFAVGQSSKKIHAYWFCIIGFIFMVTLGLSGLILGEPGIPTVGFEGRDPFLFVLIPRMIELGIVDHLLNLALAFVFTLGIVSYRRHHIKHLSKLLSKAKYSRV